MDKYEFNVRIEQIKKLVNKADYESAMKIADTIDWRRVRNVSILSMVSSIYEKNEEYQEAKDILLLAFERAPIGKRLLYKLAELAVKQGNTGEAEDYYREFCDLAPEDPRQYLLRYMILKAKGAPAEQLIHTLEQYCNIELDEKWMYELASLYSKTGMSDLCVRTCDKIMLMFGLGKYVEKAMDLKLQYAPLNKYQMDLEENRDKYEARLREVEQEYDVGGFEPDSRRPGRPERAKRVDPSKAQASEEEEEEPVYGERQPYRFYTRPERAEQEPALASAKEEEQEALAQTAASVESQEEQESGIYAAAPMEGTLEKERAVTAEQTGAVAQSEPEERPEAVEEPDSAEPVLEPGSEEAQEEEAAVGEPAVKPVYGKEAQTEEALAARVHEAEVQANLARELSRISGAEFSEESRYAQTRDLKDIRSLKVNGENVVAAGGPSDRVASHLMVEAEDPEAGLVIAVDALKRIHRELGIKNQAAKITGEKLNKRGVLALADKLVGKDLIIEYAGDMRDDMLEELNQLMDRDETGMNVVLIDNKEQLDAIKEEYPGLAKRFECIDGNIQSSQPKPPIKEEKAPEAPVGPKAPAKAPEPVPLPREEDAPRPQRQAQPQPQYQEEEEEYPQEEYSEEDETPYQQEPDTENADDEEEMDIDEFAQYACQYAAEIDCSISGKSMLALYERIEIMEEDGIPLTRTNAEDLIEEAADKAERPGLGKRMKGLFSSKYDKEGRLILKEEHFI